MNRDVGVRSRREPFHAITGCRKVRKRIRKFASGWGKTTARIVLVGVALLVALLPLAQAGSQAPGPTPPGPKVGTRRASLKVHWIRSMKQSKSNPDVDLSTTLEQRLDATILLEIPDIDYFGKPQWWVFGYAADMIIAPDKLVVPKGPPIKLPQTKLLSFSGQVSTDRKTVLTGKVMPSCPGETDTLTERGESALQRGGPFPGFMLQLIGGVATVSVTSNQFTATRQKTNSCPAAAAEPPSTVNMSISASFPEVGQNLPPDLTKGPNQDWKTRSTVDPGWTAQTTRTATGYSGTARRHYQDTPDPLWGVPDVTEEMQVTLDLWVPDYEAVMEAEGYDDWMPEGSLSGREDEAGGLIKVSVKLQLKGKPDVPVTQRATFRIELQDVSSEPGVALNWPPKDQVKSTPDLGIEQQWNPMLKLTGQTWETKGSEAAKEAETKKKDTQVRVFISSFDWGAWGTLKLTADTEDGQHLVAHLKNDPSVEELKIPKDSDGNHIADAYKKQYGVEPGAAAESDRDATEPTGNGFVGDGISLYEKYRGFVVTNVQGTTRHVRLNPTKKALFVDTEWPELEPGIELFRAASGLAVYEINDDEMDDKHVINFNSKTAHAVDQHGLWLTEGPLDERLAGRSYGIGPPKNVERVVIYYDRKRGVFETSTTVAHELGHAVRMPHHGNTNHWVDSEFRKVPRDSSDAKYSVAVEHGQNSGGEDCIMRYPPADYVEKIKNGVTIYYGYAGVLPDNRPKLRFCRGDGGTGVNAPGHRPWPIAGDATPMCGDSKGHLVVSDRFEGPPGNSDLAPCLGQH